MPITLCLASVSMKRLIFLSSAALLFVACSTPEQRAQADAAHRRRQAAEHQRDLEDEARENFQREREQQDEARRDAAEDAADRSREVAEKRQEAAEDAARYRAYEAEYARQLGKKPSQFTPAERAWIREKFD